MSAPAVVTQADAERLFAAARKAGLRPVRVKLSRDGGLEMYFNGGASAHDHSGAPVELD